MLLQWEHERWKFDNRNMVMFYSQLTGKALRVKGDGTVDGLGEEKEKGGKSARPGIVFQRKTSSPAYDLCILNFCLSGKSLVSHLLH